MNGMPSAKCIGAHLSALLSKHLAFKTRGNRHGRWKEEKESDFFAMLHSVQLPAPPSRAVKDKQVMGIHLVVF